MSQQSERMKRMLAVDGSTVELVVERGHLQRGRSFSEEAIEEVNDDMATWVGTRLLQRWERTEEPPSRLLVRVTVEVS